jgi:hypothetical protein
VSPQQTCCGKHSVVEESSPSTEGVVYQHKTPRNLAEERACMKTDFYTKVILTVIALGLIGNFLQPVFLTPPPVQAAGEEKFGHVQMVTSQAGIGFFDTRTGDVWEYVGGISGTTNIKRSRLVALGQPIQKLQGN